MRSSTALIQSPPDEVRQRRLLHVAEQTPLATPDSAVTLIRRALDTMDLHDPRRGEYLGRLVTAELFTGRLRSAESLARDALNDPDVDESSRAALTYGLAQTLFLQGRLIEAAELFAAAGVAPPSAHDPSLLADAAMTHMLAGQLDPAIEAGERALLVARARGDVVAEVAALAVLCSSLGLRGELGPALECGRAAASRADNGGVPEAHWNMPHLFLATALLWADQVEDCREALERAAVIGDRLELAWHHPIRLATLADLQYRVGDWHGAVASAEAGLCRSLDRGSGFADVWIQSLLARIHLHQDRLDLAVDATDRAEHAATAGGSGIERVAGMRALCAEAQGDLDAALATVQSLWHALDERGVAVKLLELSCDAARIARRVGDHHFGETVIETARQLARRCPDTAAPAFLARCRGLIEADAELLARAATMLRLRRRPIEQAFTEWEAGHEFARRGDGDRAARFRAAAAVVLDPINARPLPIDDAADEFQPCAGARFGWASLTQSERNVVALVADGLSNAEIADRLICSRRTVESHLHHVYTKLGTSSRVALAVEARHRLAG